MSGGPSTRSDERSSRRSPGQLPPGRHGLARSYVARNQRDRIVAAVVETVRETGYAGLTVAHVLATSGVSRPTFYEHYANKEDAFIAAYDAVLGFVAAKVQAAYDRGRDYPERVRLGLGEFVFLHSSRPDLAYVCVVEVLAAGPRALARRDAAMAAFREYFVPPKGEVPPGRVTPLVAELVVGGVYEIVYEHVRAGRAAQLPDLFPELLEQVLVPLVGRRRAAREAAAARRAGLPAPEGDP